MCNLMHNQIFQAVEGMAVMVPGQKLTHSAVAPEVPSELVVEQAETFWLSPIDSSSAAVNSSKVTDSVTETDPQMSNTLTLYEAEAEDSSAAEHDSQLARQLLLPEVLGTEEVAIV